MPELAQAYFPRAQLFARAFEPQPRLILALNFRVAQRFDLGGQKLFGEARLKQF